MLKWAEQHWAQEGVVDDEERAGSVGDLCDRWDVGNAHPWIGEPLAEDDLGVRLHRCLHRRVIGDWHWRHLNAARWEIFGEEDLTDDEEVVGDDQVITRLEVGEESRGDRRHPRRRGDRALRAFECGELLFESSGGGIVGARVEVGVRLPGERSVNCGLLFVGRLEGEGRRLIDRQVVGAGRGVNALTGVDRQGVERRVLQGLLAVFCHGESVGAWSGRRGSNSRPSAWEADALPTELLPRGGHGSKPARRRSRALGRMGDTERHPSRSRLVRCPVVVTESAEPPS